MGSLQKLVAFYGEEHNTRLPHFAFQGETPDEMYFGTGGHLPEELAARRDAARAATAEGDTAAPPRVKRLTKCTSGPAATSRRSSRCGGKRRGRHAWRRTERRSARPVN